MRKFEVNCQGPPNVPSAVPPTKRVKSLISLLHGMTRLMLPIFGLDARMMPDVRECECEKTGLNIEGISESSTGVGIAAKLVPLHPIMLPLIHPILDLLLNCLQFLSMSATNAHRDLDSRLHVS